MDDISKVFDLIRQIREYNGYHPEIEKNPYYIPESTLINIIDVFNCDSISIIIVERNGFFNSQRRVGKLVTDFSTVKSFNVLDEIIQSNTNSFFKLNKPDSIKGFHSIFGFLEIHRKKSFTELEIKALSEVSYFISAIIINNSQQLRFKKIYAFQNYLYTLDAKSILAGTLMVKLINKFHGITFSTYSIFFIVNNDVLNIEYEMISSSVQTTMRDTFVKSKLLTKTIKNLPPNQISFLWQEPIENIENKLNLKHISNLKEFNTFIYPIYCDNELVGGFMFVLCKYAILSEYEYLNSICNLIEKKFNDSFNYLFQRRVKKMIVNPIYKNRNTRIDQSKIFVLMPFEENWSKRIWSKFIKKFCEDLGYNAVRADDLYGVDIMEDVWSEICTSSLIIADITNRNPNVFYELGIAHALGKDVILLTQNIKDIPFDLNRYRHIIYEDNQDGYEKLEKELKNKINSILKRQ